MNNVTALRPSEPDPTPQPTTNRRDAVLTMITANQVNGMTWREVAKTLGVGHGSASAILSTLHAEGVIVRLTESRNESKVYVLPEWVNGRDTETPRRSRRTALLDDMAAVLHQVPTGCEHYYWESNCRSCEIRRVLRLYDARQY